MRLARNKYSKILLCTLLIMLGANGPAWAEDSPAFDIKRFLKNSDLNVSPLVSLIKPDMSSHWSQAVLTSDASAETNTGLGIQAGLEKPGYELNSALLMTSWSNATYTSVMFNYQKNFQFAEREELPAIRILNKLGLVAGAGLGLGYFSNALTGDNSIGPIVNIYVGQQFDITPSWSIFYNLSYQYINLSTSDTNALNNTHTVTLKNAKLATLGAKYYFGAKRKLKISKPAKVETVSHSPAIVKNNYIVQGRWINSAGQNIDSNANPHYKISVGKMGGGISIGLKSSENSHLYLLDATNNVIASESQLVNKKATIQMKDLKPGEYIIVAATKEPGVQVPFTLSATGNIDSLTEMEFIENTITGKVTNLDTGIPLANVKVKVFLNDGDLIVFTDSNGYYALPVDLKYLPDAFAMAFSLEGYVPVTKNISKKNGSGFIKNTAMEPVSLNTVILELEPYLHHLGDGNFRGALNSQFQTAVEGKSFSISFYISKEHLAATSGQITLQAKGLNLKNQLLLNNSQVASMNVSPVDGSFGDLKYQFDTSLLREGTNRLSVTSVTNDGVKDYDDFEFTNVILRLEFQSPEKSVDD